MAPRLEAYGSLGVLNLYFLEHYEPCRSPSTTRKARGNLHIPLYSRASFSYSTPHVLQFEPLQRGASLRLVPGSKFTLLRALRMKKLRLREYRGDQYSGQIGISICIDAMSSRPLRRKDTILSPLTQGAGGKH